MTTLPIDPDKVQGAKNSQIPSVVITTVNAMIVEKWDGSSATLKQKDIVARVVDCTDYMRDEIYANKWMDFEDVFRRAGWKVYYDKPWYNESYDATFKFSKDKKHSELKETNEITEKLELILKEIKEINRVPRGMGPG